ncbi:MAG: YicC family protein [Pseudomonadales bacterium]|nr:YicC family protein [Pseudomonadales bacterium]
MIHSMTGFSRQQAHLNETQIIWEIRTVNHRYLELAIRLPDNLRHLEELVRKQIKSHLQRGKIECSLKLSHLGGEQSDIHINQTLLDNLVQHCEALNQKLSKPAPLSAIELLQWPGATQQTQENSSLLEEKTLELLGMTLNDLSASREREGQALCGFLQQRNQSIQQQTREIRERCPELNKAYRDKLLSRLKEFDLETRSERIEQELVIMAQKLDISEELDRLQHHCEEVARILEKGGAVGRRLDFIMQEFNREANTLASKSNNIDNTLASVELKVLIEQMREQVQNIE